MPFYLRGYAGVLRSLLLASFGAGPALRPMPRVSISETDKRQDFSIILYH